MCHDGLLITMVGYKICRFALWADLPAHTQWATRSTPVLFNKKVKQEMCRANKNVGEVRIRPSETRALHRAAESS